MDRNRKAILSYNMVRRDLKIRNRISFYQKKYNRKDQVELPVCRLLSIERDGRCNPVYIKSYARMFYEGFGKSMKEEIKNYTYMLLCADGTYYTGWTNQIRKRIRAHNSGKGAKYTKGRGPLKLVYLEISDTKEAAMKREAAIKKLTRREKEALIQTEESLALVRQVTEISFDN